MIRISIFIDTNILVSYFNKRDENHEKSEKLLKDIFEKKKYGDPITSDYVFDESVNVCILRTKSKELSIKFGDMIINSIPMLNVTIPIFQMSWALFKKVKMSFTDCTNIILVLTYGIKNIATFDKEFKRINNINVVDN